MFVISSGFNGRTSAFIGLEGENMSLEKIKTYFAKHGLSDRIKVFQQSSATVQLAALALGCQEGYLDISLKRFETVYPAAGTYDSAVELSLSELETCSLSKGWIDVCQLKTST